MPKRRQTNIPDFNILIQTTTKGRDDALVTSVVAVEQCNLTQEQIKDTSSFLTNKHGHLGIKGLYFLLFSSHG